VNVVASKKEQNRKTGWIFISVAVVLALVFLLYPIIYSIILSFHSTKGMTSHFVGFGNIERLLKDKILFKALYNNFIFLIFQVPIMLTLGLVFAVMLNSTKIKFRGFYRLALFLPCVTSLVAYSVLFKMIFQIDGIVNNLLMNIHLISSPINWLNDPFWARVTIIIALCWRWTGYNMMFYLSGLQNISRDTLEAAEIDGAGKIRQFFYIIIPQLKPVILFTTIMSTIGTIQLFDEVVNLTEGGPANATLTISQYIYNHSFVFASNFGYSAALSYVIVLIVSILAYIQFKVAGDNS
jgi:lactose/L-arabinose transport system permease protein